MKEALRLEPPVPRAVTTTVTDTTLPSGGGADWRGPIFVAKVCISSICLPVRDLTNIIIKRAP